MNGKTHEPRVLVVDDEPSMGQLMADCLEGTCTVTVTSRAAEGEERLRTGDYHVLLCDAVLPGESGVAFLSRIKLQYPHLRRILVSGLVDQPGLAEALNTGGIVSFIGKPFDPGTLRDAVSRAVADSLRTRRQAALEAEWHYTRHNAPPQKLLALLADLVISGRLAVLLIVVFGMLGLLFAGGVAILFLLYSLKTWLGIDFFEDMHFHDFWRHFWRR